MKVTFPHIGSGYIPFNILLRELGVEPVMPPFVSQRTIELGTKYSPEFACFPFKINVGNFIEGMERGADVVLMAGGVGPCRFGFYGEVQREILAEAGYFPEFFVLEAPKTHPRELWEKIKRIFPRHRFRDIARAIYKAWLKGEGIDRFDRLANKIRAIEVNVGAVSSLQDEFYRRLDSVSTTKEIRRVRDEALAELRQIPVKKNVKPLRIILLGELYMVLEQGVNFQLERRLGEMGVEVQRTIYFSDWFKDQLIRSIFDPNWRAVMSATARPYLGHFVGGHGLETIAHAVDGGINNFDGLIQLAPFTCMPEIVAMQVLPTVSHDLQIPYMTLIIDEHSAEAGVMTRIEAFVDLLEHQRNKKNGGKSLEVVSGS